MLYFKDAPLSPSQIDGDQIDRVNGFRTSLGDEGVLYWKFKDEEGFASLVHVHLVRQLQAWGSAWGTGDSTPECEQQNGSNGDVPEDDEQPGFLDLIESTEDNLGRATESLGQITSLLEDFTADIAAATSGLGEAKDAKKVYKTFANQMETFSTAIAEKTELMADGQAGGMRAFTLPIPIMCDFGTPERDEIESIKRMMTGHREAVLESKASMVELRDVVAEQARSTTAFNRAKKRVVDSLDRLIAVHDEGLVLATEIDKAISELRPPTGRTCPISSIRLQRLLRIRFGAPVFSIENTIGLPYYSR